MEKSMNNLKKIIEKTNKLIDKRTKDFETSKKTLEEDIQRESEQAAVLSDKAHRAILSADNETYQAAKAGAKAAEDNEAMHREQLAFLNQRSAIDDTELQKVLDELHKGFSDYEAKCQEKIVTLLKEAYDISVDLKSCRDDANTVIHLLMLAAGKDIYAEIPEKVDTPLVELGEMAATHPIYSSVTGKGLPSARQRALDRINGIDRTE